MRRRISRLRRSICLGQTAPAAGRSAQPRDGGAAHSRRVKKSNQERFETQVSRRGMSGRNHARRFAEIGSTMTGPSLGYSRHHDQHRGRGSRYGIEGKSILAGEIAAGAVLGLPCLISAVVFVTKVGGRTNGLVTDRSGDIPPRVRDRAVRLDRREAPRRRVRENEGHEQCDEDAQPLPCWAPQCSPHPDHHILRSTPTPARDQALEHEPYRCAGYHPTTSRSRRGRRTRILVTTT